MQLLDEFGVLRRNVGEKSFDSGVEILNVVELVGLCLEARLHPFSSGPQLRFLCKAFRAWAVGREG